MGSWIACIGSLWERNQLILQMNRSLLLSQWNKSLSISPFFFSPPCVCVYVYVCACVDVCVCDGFLKEFRHFYFLSVWLFLSLQFINRLFLVNMECLPISLLISCYFSLPGPLSLFFFPKMWLLFFAFFSAPSVLVIVLPWYV